MGGGVKLNVNGEEVGSIVQAFAFPFMMRDSDSSVEIS